MRKNSCVGSFSEFLSHYLTPQVWKQAHQAWEREHCPSRWRLPALVWVLLGMAWCLGDSLDERFATARAVYVASHLKERRPGDSLAGFLAALERLPMSVLRALALALRQQMGKQFVEELRINGWVPLGCDGTRVACPRTRELQERLGEVGKTRAAPMVSLIALVVLPIGLPWSWSWGKGNADERYHLQRLLGTLPQQTLLVMDAFYQSYQLFAAIQKVGADFLVRLSSRSCLYTLKEVRLKPFREGVVYYWPDESARRQGLPPIKARVMKVRGHKTDVWLLTSVLDKKQLSRKTAALVYRWRWRNEGMFRQYKCLLKKTKLQSRTIASVHREGEGAMLALQLLLAHAAQKVKKGAQTVIVTDSARRALLHIRAAQQTTLRSLGPRQWQAYMGLLVQIRCEARTRRSNRVRQKWPGRGDHKPPKPPKMRVMNDKLKAFMNKILNAT